MAQGTSGSWYYRKWNSGFAECWRTATEYVTVGQWGAWGGIYLTPGVASLALPFTVYSPQQSTTVCCVEKYTVCLAIVGNTTSSQTSGMSCFRGAAPDGPVNLIYNISVIGRWKG